MSIKHIARFLAPLGVAFALMLAGTMPAFASWGDSTYAIWRDISASMPTTQSPHGTYSTTSQKCGVCHSVHSANPTGQMLLKSTAADACSYCHIVAGVSDYVVYDGIEGNYKGTDFQNAHNSGFGVGDVSCADCHSVHAAETKMTANEYLTSKILKGDKDYDMWTKNYDEYAQAPLVGDVPEAALSKWCTSCHIAAEYGYYRTDYAEPKYTHIMADFTLNYSQGSIEPTQVAWASSRNCSSCHSSDFGDNSHSWPHYTSGARFLVSAQSSVVATSGTEIGKTSYDGVCLRCHRDGSRGVGLSF